MRAHLFRYLPIALFLLVLAPAANAHPPDLIAVRARAHGETVEQVIRLNAQTLLRLAPLGVDAHAVEDGTLQSGLAVIEAGVWDDMPLHSGERRCSRGPSSASVVDGLVELRASFNCAEGDLRQDFRLLAVLPEGHHVTLSLESGKGAPLQRFAHRDTPSIVLTGAASSPESARDFGGWVLLGIQHILEGFDHLAFLAALLLLGGGVRRILVLVTGFTVAHSITLGAAALGLVRIGPTGAALVEFAIAASIVVVAALNLRGGEGRHRVLLTFGFGLLHGFGFAGVLGSYGLGEQAWVSLLGFNLGVELGQAVVVLLVAPALAWLRAHPLAGRWVVPIGSFALLMLGLWWSVERIVPATVFQASSLG